MKLTVERRPRVGDLVRSKMSGRVYRVTDIYRAGPGRYARIASLGLTSLEDGRPNALLPGEYEVLSSLVATDIVLRRLAGPDKCTSAKAVARELWPDSPGWHRSSKVGYGSTTGVGPPRAAGVELSRLIKLGAAKSCGPYDHSPDWVCYGYRPVGAPLLERDTK